MHNVTETPVAVAALDRQALVADSRTLARELMAAVVCGVTDRVAAMIVEKVLRDLCQPPEVGWTDDHRMFRVMAGGLVIEPKDPTRCL